MQYAFCLEKNSSESIGSRIKKTGIVWRKSKMKRKDNNDPLKFARVADRVMKIKRQQSRYERSINAIWELFSDYSEISTIHGVRYLGEKKRHWSERVWWFLSIVISIGLSAKFISQASSKWINSPVIVSFSEESTPVHKIPFPGELEKNPKKNPIIVIIILKISISSGHHLHGY